MKKEFNKDQMAILEADTTGRLRRDFPSLYLDSLKLIDTSTTRLGIDDVWFKMGFSINDELEMLQLACKGWLEMYNGENLVYSLKEKLEPLFRVLNKRKTILVFPGTGSKFIKTLMQDAICEMGIVEIPTQRKVNASGVVEGVELGEKTVFRETVANRKAENIVVIDDVIVTGSTLKTIQQAFPMRGLEWFGASLMMLSPLQRREKTKIDSGVEGYKSIIAPIIYQGITGIPAVNSLSTLIGESEKSKMVRAKYIRDYVEDEQVFLQVVDTLQNKLKGGG